MSLHIRPVTLKEANSFVALHHRHNKPTVGHRFSVGLADDSGELVGVAIVGNPVARALNDGRTLEVTRTCTDGTRNANSMLYGAAWRAAKALGWERLVTYTQLGESGASLLAAGWTAVADLPPRGGWDTPSRARTDAAYMSTARVRWQITTASFLLKGFERDRSGEAQRRQ